MLAIDALGAELARREAVGVERPIERAVRLGLLVDAARAARIDIARDDVDRGERSYALGGACCGATRSEGGSPPQPFCEKFPRLRRFQSGSRGRRLRPLKLVNSGF